MKVCEICGARFRGDPAACPLDGGTREREVSDAMESVLEETLARNIELQRELSRTSSARTSA